MTTKTLIGHVPVDSGQIMIVDPCYVLNGDVRFDKDNKTVITNNPYSRACAASMSDDQAGPFSTDGVGHMTDAVCSSTGWGDGMYPVYVEYEDGRVKTVTIDFSDIEYNDDDWDEDED